MNVDRYGAAGATFVYFLRPVGAAGPIKIGLSRYPETRLRVLMAWSPLQLEIAAQTPGDRDLEMRLHGAFIGAWTHGEWFRPVRPLTSLIDAVRGGRLSVLGKLGPSVNLAARNRPPMAALNRVKIGLATRLAAVMGVPAWVSGDYSKFQRHGDLAAGARVCAWLERVAPRPASTSTGFFAVLAANRANNPPIPPGVAAQTQTAGEAGDVAGGEGACAHAPTLPQGGGVCASKAVQKIGEDGGDAL